MSRQLCFLPAALAVALLFSGQAPAQIVLSDSFDRTTGDPGDPGPPQVDGFSDWGTTDNAVGGTAAGQAYQTFDTALANEVTDGSNGIINFGRTILDYNLAQDADVIAAQAITIRVDVNPSDVGATSNPGSNNNGRDWLGFLLADTNQPSSLGAQFALTGGNGDARVGIGPRNSGSAITRRGPANRKLNGNPLAGNFNEPIYDPVVHADYIAWASGGDGTASGDPVEDFPNANWYTFQMVIEPDTGVSLFDDNAAHQVRFFSGPQGGPLTPLDPDPSTPGTIETLFSWGDNVQSAGGSDPGTPGADAYLVFVGNESDHRFDNLVVFAGAVPEPTSIVLVCGGLAGLMFRRKR